MTFAIGMFAFSLLGLSTLFTVKHLEVRRGAVYAPLMRRRLDRFAKMIKAILRLLSARAQELPYDFAIFLRMVVHLGAVVFARGARAAERGAHKVADRVSHKYRFERTESRSEFLKTVNAHKQALDPAKGRIQ